MKMFFGLVVVVALGIGLGYALADLRLGDLWWTPTANLNETASTPDTEPGTLKPKLAIDKTKYDFGTLDLKSGGKHDFVFTNAGDAPLKLIPGGTSCRCTTSEFKDKEIPPGGSEKITISWKPAHSVGPYQQTAKVLTNDPEHQEVTLTVLGKITAVTQVYPTELIFSRVTANEPAEANARLLCYLDKEFKITNHKWTDAETADNFEVSLQPLLPEELAQWPTSKSGYLATVTVKPGLPQGPFKQKLEFETNLLETPKLTLPIEGIVGSEISIAGPGWDEDKGVLTVGAVSSDRGASRKLYLTVRGSHRKSISFEPIDVWPDSIKVTLGERRDINNGQVTQTPLTIEIPPGSPTVNCLGSELGKLGEIVLKTTHPQVPKLRILVKMAIEN